MPYSEIVETYCPFCGEPTQVHCGGVGMTEEFVEDCTVCCQPMVVRVTWEDEEPYATVERESD